MCPLVPPRSPVICRGRSPLWHGGCSADGDDDEILILPHGSHEIQIAQYIYEMIVLSVPQKKVHPGIADGTLKSEILEKLKSNQVRVF